MRWSISSSESQNRSQAIARKYAQLLLAERYDEANHLHDEVGIAGALSGHS